MVHINTNSKKIISKKDIFIILAILLTGIIVISVTFINKKINPGKTAVISVDSEIIEKIDLETHKNNTFSLENVKGVVFEVNNGKIRIIESDCPDKICVKTDFLDSKSEKIVCLPKKLIVEIED